MDGLRLTLRESSFRSSLIVMTCEEKAAFGGSGGFGSSFCLFSRSISSSKVMATQPPIKKSGGNVTTYQHTRILNKALAVARLPLFLLLTVCHDKVEYRP